MSESWKQLEGQIVDGKFPLQRYLGGDEQHAVFMTTYGESEAETAAIKLVSDDGRSAKRQLQSWRRAEKLSHPHLMRLYTSGRARVSDMTVLYVVMEYAEENLGEVLTHRSLTPEEAREMLEPTLTGLAYVHAEGFVHGHLEPSNIHAVDGSLRLSSDQLSRTGDYGPGKPGPYDPPELATEGYSPAGDVWSLGTTLVQAMTQKLPQWDPKGTEEPTGTESLGEPFGEIARQCLRRNPRARCTVAAVQDLLQNPIVAAPVKRAKETRGAPHKLIYALSGLLALILLGIIFGPGLRTHSDGLPVTSVQPQIAPGAAAATKVEPAQPEVKASDRRSKKNKKEKTKAVSERVPTAAVPTARPVPVAPATQPPPATAATSDDSVHQVLPEVTSRARRSIHGRVRVAVKVTVDTAGNVVNAELASPGPSQYFAQEALQASRRWKFPAAKDGNGSRVFTVNYQFLANDTKTVVTPESK